MSRIFPSSQWSHATNCWLLAKVHQLTNLSHVRMGIHTFFSDQSSDSLHVSKKRKMEKQTSVKKRIKPQASDTETDTSSDSDVKEYRKKVAVSEPEVESEEEEPDPYREPEEELNDE